MAEHWATAEPSGCDPEWATDCQPTDQPPTQFDLRRDEMWDLRGQGPGPVALWTAHTITVGDLL